MKLINDRIKLLHAIHEVLEKPVYKGIVYRSIFNRCADKEGKRQLLSLSQEKAGKVSFANSLKTLLDDDKRQRTSINKYIRKQLRIDKKVLSDKKLDMFCRDIIEELSLKIDEYIEISTGGELMERYENTSESSCMTGGDYEKTALYAENPDKVGFVEFDHPDFPYARFLIWWICGETVVDRIYPNSGNHIAAIKQWAHQKGYYVREQHGAPETHEKPRNSKGETKEFVFELDYPLNDTFPYIDTFQYGEINRRNGGITLSNVPNLPIIFDNTCGDYSENTNLWFCSICEDCADTEQMHRIRICGHIQDVCDYCYENKITNCGHCGDYDFVADSHINTDGEFVCDYCYRTAYDECEKCGELFDNDDFERRYALR